MISYATVARPHASVHRNRLRAAITIAIAALLAVTGIALSPSAQAATTTTGIFSDSLTPQVAADPDRVGVELGIKFSPGKTGRVTALQYYQSSKAAGVTKATLWSSSGTVLAQASFPESTTPGLRTVSLKTPVELAAGSTYIASYYAPKGAYPSIARDLSTARTMNGFSLPANAGVYAYGSSSKFPTSSYNGSNYLVDVVFTPSVSGGSTMPDSPTVPTPTTTATPSPIPTPTATATPTPTANPAPPAESGGIVVLGRSFPSEATTGVPAGVTLSTYTGPCTIKTPNVVIDKKIVNCALYVNAANVTITNSVINGPIHTSSTSGSFTVTDSEIRLAPDEDTGVGEANFTLTRVEITGSRRSVNCALNCTVQDSFLHAQGRDLPGGVHESGIRMGANSIIRHNTLTCDAPAPRSGGGCSAALTGYGDFATVEKNTIDNNLFLESEAGYCAYGGSSDGKPYSAGVNNVKFTNNIWERGSTGVCGIWGPIVAFDRNAPGNVWSGNMYDNGKIINP